MKLKLFLMGIMCLTASVGLADTLDDVKSLPDTIVIDTADETLNFQKGTRPDSFYVTDDGENGKIYRQTYHNAICFASVTYEPAHIGRMSNIKMKRELKDISHFQITRQDKYKSGKKVFYMNIGAMPEQTTVLMLSGKETTFLKVHLSCQSLAQKTALDNEKTTIYWAKQIVDTIVPVLGKSVKEK